MIWRKLPYLFPSRRRAEERDMQEELDALAQIAGKRELGNLTQAAENARETWQWTSIEAAMADVRYAARGLRRNPGLRGRGNRHARRGHRRQHGHFQRGEFLVSSAIASPRPIPAG